VTIQSTRNRARLDSYSQPNAFQTEQNATNGHCSCGDWGQAIEQALPKRKVIRGTDADGGGEGKVSVGAKADTGVDADVDADAEDDAGVDADADVTVPSASDTKLSP
jgi:hypothetical protein